MNHFLFSLFLMKTSIPPSALSSSLAAPENSRYISSFSVSRIKTKGSCLQLGQTSSHRLNMITKATIFGTVWREVITWVRLIAMWAGFDIDGTAIVFLGSVNTNQFIPGDDQPVLHVAAGQEQLLRLLRSPEYGPGLTVIPRVSILLCAPEMVTVSSSMTLHLLAWAHH